MQPRAFHNSGSSEVHRHVANKQNRATVAFCREGGRPTVKSIVMLTPEERAGRVRRRAPPE